MSEYIFLTNPNRCPGCGNVSRSPKNGFCGACGLRLFANVEQNFRAYSDETGQNFWAFDRNKGWIHRDHLLIKDAQPLSRKPTLPDIPEGYGKHTTPEEVASLSGKTFKRTSSRLP